MLLVHEQQGSLEWYLSRRHSVISGGCKRKIYENTDSVCKMSECWKMTYQKSFTFRCNSGTQISAATWQTVHEHIVAELIIRALLVHEQQTLLKWCLSSRHSAVCVDCKRKKNENTGSVRGCCGCCYVQTSSAAES